MTVVGVSIVARSHKREWYHLVHNDRNWFFEKVLPRDLEMSRIRLPVGVIWRIQTSKPSVSGFQACPTSQPPATEALPELTAVKRDRSARRHPATRIQFGRMSLSGFHQKRVQGRKGFRVTNRIEADFELRLVEILDILAKRLGERPGDKTLKHGGGCCLLNSAS